VNNELSKIISTPDLSQPGSCCPIPISDYPQVLLAHGGGGKLTHQLIGKMFTPAFRNPFLDQAHDGSVFDPEGAKMAFSTDSYVIHPLFFPGGDIGQLAVNGTVNDLAMCGAKPLYLSAAFIIEEGLSMETLWRVVDSMRRQAELTGVQIITGDTKVVDRGKGDGLYINTAGIGMITHQLDISPISVCEGDVILLSGDIGRHGIAIMAVREGLEFETVIESDCASVNDPVQGLISAGIPVHCLRDLTRGGLASALIEIAETSGKGIHIEEKAIPLREDVQGACEILGFDPLYVANEGRFICILPQEYANRALEILRGYSVCEESVIIGAVEKDRRAGQVTITSKIGARRIVDMMSGEQLPRIC
jgi:hydrogenase expression/formation protein HypE